MEPVSVVVFFSAHVVVTRFCIIPATIRLSDFQINVQRDYQPLFTLVQPLHTEMADKGAFTVYTATFTKFLACCKDLQNPVLLR